MFVFHYVILGQEWFVCFSLRDFRTGVVFFPRALLYWNHQKWTCNTHVFPRLKDDYYYYLRLSFHRDWKVHADHFTWYICTTPSHPPQFHTPCILVSLLLSIENFVPQTSILVWQKLEWTLFHKFVFGIVCEGARSDRHQRELAAASGPTSHWGHLTTVSCQTVWCGHRVRRVGWNLILLCCTALHTCLSLFRQGNTQICFFSFFFTTSNLKLQCFWCVWFFFFFFMMGEREKTYVYLRLPFQSKFWCSSAWRFIGFLHIVHFAPYLGQAVLAPQVFHNFQVFPQFESGMHTLTTKQIGWSRLLSLNRTLYWTN